jgi:molybdate transport system permease protein
MDFNPAHLEAYVITLKLAFLTSFLTLLLAVPFCFWLRLCGLSKLRYSEFFIYLPLVLPPTVLGFLFLSFFSGSSVIGQLLSSYEISMVFSFFGILVASCLYALPFVIPVIASRFASIEQSLFDASKIYGHSNFRTLFSVVVPISWPSLLRAFLLCFVHTMGEFGVILLIGGSIPGKTKTISIEIFDNLQMLKFSEAKFLVLVSMVIAIFFIGLAIFVSEKQKSVH